MSRFTMRIEVWEKDPDTNETFSEYGELYFRDGNRYFAFNSENQLVEIPNPFKGRLPLRPFNKVCKKIYAIGEEIGYHLPSGEVLSVDGYPIDSIDIIFHEEEVFPKMFHRYYDNDGNYHKEVETDFYQLIDDLKEKN